jgi:hypothetical protein
MGDGRSRYWRRLTRHRQFPARCVPVALDRPSDAHRLASPREGVNGDLMNIRYVVPTCQFGCPNRTAGPGHVVGENHPLTAVSDKSCGH